MSSFSPARKAIPPAGFCERGHCNRRGGARRRLAPIRHPAIMDGMDEAPPTEGRTMATTPGPDAGGEDWGEQLFEAGLEFADNPEPRCPCVLLVDTSGSMKGDRIRALTDGLRA